MTQNNQECWVFIDDSCKLYDKNNYTIYNFLIFFNYNDYLDFETNFKENLKQIYDKPELKGSEFWTKKITMEEKILLLKTIKKYKNVHLFSITLNKKELHTHYNNDIEAENILNKSIAMLCDYMCKKLKIKNTKLNLLIDEQIRTKDIEKFLNRKKSDFLSIQRLRIQKITFNVNPNIKSHNCPGVMFSDIIANGINRIKNKNAIKIEKIIQENTNLKINYFNWPETNNLKNHTKKIEELSLKDIFVD